jgi:hypothetical protein
MKMRRSRGAPPVPDRRKIRRRVVASLTLLDGADRLIGSQNRAKTHNSCG